MPLLAIGFLPGLIILSFNFKEPTLLPKSAPHTSLKGIANLQINYARQNILSKKNRWFKNHRFSVIYRI